MNGSKKTKLTPLGGGGLTLTPLLWLNNRHKANGLKHLVSWKETQMFEVTNPFYREFIYRVWRCLESANHPGASIVKDETTGAGVDAVGQYADSFFVGGECASLEVHPGEVLAVPRRGGGFPVILVSSAVQHWLENNGGDGAILGVWWDSRTDNVILDRSTDVSGLSNALALGRARGESDIWNVANGCCVPVAG